MMTNRTAYTPLQGFQPYARLSDGTAAPDTLVFSQSWEDGYLNTRVKNNSTRHLKLAEIVLYESPIPFAGVTADCSFYGEGFQMLAQYAGTVANPRVVGSYGSDWDFFKLPRNAYNQNLWTVYNFITFMPKGQDTLLFGFTSVNRFSGELRFSPTHFEIVMNTENIQLDRGEEWVLEELFAASGNRDELIEEMARRINGHHPRHVWPEIPTGWCSYYCLRPMTADGLVANAEAMAKRIPELKMIQIDAGYSDRRKGWLAPNPRMGGDMKSTCDRIRATGMEAAGYLTPFWIPPEAMISLDHPEWLIQDEAGLPTNRQGRKNFILDCSNPEARAYVVNCLKHFHDEWGIRYFKLDFLAYGAFPTSGVRYNPKATSVECYRTAMQEIFDALGADSFILACNAPIWPSIGLCHGNRATNDIARDWKHVHKNAEELFWRNWQNNTFWYNDPDVIVLEPIDLSSYRPDGTWADRRCTLTEDEFEFHKAFGVACGGMVLGGDLLTDMSDKSIDVMKRLLPPTGVAAKFDDLTFKVGRVYKDGKMILTLFNWTEQPQQTDIPLDQEYAMQDFWTDEDLGTHKGLYSVTLPPHAGRVITCSALPYDMKKKQ